MNAFQLLANVRSVERPSSLRLLLAVPGHDGLSTTDGHVVRDYGVEAALMQGLPFIPLSRTEAPGFALPQRTAVAGLSNFAGPRGRWSVVVAATALRQRDREVRAVWRLIFGVLIASGLVLAFGGVALRKQRKELELELERELALAELQREREEELVRIDKLATLGALATGIAHEVSTPLAVIIGRAEQILPKVTNDPAATGAPGACVELPVAKERHD
ncbi:MAG TPA: hypothetical protein VF395_15950 [Polyangiaceae bacterium]